MARTNVQVLIISSVAILLALLVLLGSLFRGSAPAAPAATEEKPPSVVAAERHPEPLPGEEATARVPVARGVLIIKVVDDRGYPVPEAMVLLVDDPHARFVHPTDETVLGAADEVGIIEIAPVSSETHLVVHAEGFAPERIIVLPDDRRKTVVLTAGVEFTALCVDAARRPVDRVEVLLSKKRYLTPTPPWKDEATPLPASIPTPGNDAEVYRARSGPDGRVVIQGMRPGRYMLRVTAPLPYVLEAKIPQGWEVLVPSQTMHLVFHTLYGLVLRIEGDELCTWTHEIEHGSEKIGTENGNYKQLSVTKWLRRRFSGWPVLVAGAAGDGAPLARMRICLARSGWIERTFTMKPVLDLDPAGIIQVLRVEDEHWLEGYCGRLMVVLRNPDGSKISFERAMSFHSLWAFPTSGWGQGYFGQVDLGEEKYLVPDEYGLSVTGMPWLRGVLGKVKVEPGELSVVDKTLDYWIYECEITVRKPWSGDASIFMGGVRAAKGGSTGFANQMAGSPFRLWLPEGACDLRFHADGYRSVRETVEILPLRGEVQRFEFLLEHANG